MVFGEMLTRQFLEVVRRQARPDEELELLQPFFAYVEER